MRAELVREKSRLSADGTSRPVIALRLFDRYEQARAAGHAGLVPRRCAVSTWWEVDSLHDNQLIATGPREPTFEVGTDGIALIELEPTTQSGTALVRLRFNDRLTQETAGVAGAGTRDWILVGMAEGTACTRASRAT